MVKERPIIFCSELISAILDDRKTMTRRVIKPQPVGYRTCWSDDLEACDIYIETDDSLWKACESKGRNKRDSGELTPVEIKCPYGKVGDKLWVREKYAITNETKYNKKGRFSAQQVRYYSDNNLIWYDAEKINCLPKIGIHSSILMPKWATRIWLEITGIRVERLQEISEEDAIAEGIEFLGWDYAESSDGTGDKFLYWNNIQQDMPKWCPNSATSCECIEDVFSWLWDSLNAKPKTATRNPYTNERELCKVGYPWESVREETIISRKSSRFHGCKIYIVGNPWLRAISFKRIKDGD